MIENKDIEKKNAEFSEVQTWFTIRSLSASKSDIRFYITMTPKETIKFLERYIENKKSQKI